LVDSLDLGLIEADCCNHRLLIYWKNYMIDEILRIYVIDHESFKS